jgi:hypothetical protein
LVLPDEETKKKLITLLSKHLIYQEKPQLGFTDKIVSWFSEIIPDDEEKSLISNEKKLAAPL